ncbi:MAG: beta-N-acetylhexosaminidase [Sedimentisphaeraceae bacterium JB056]
MFSGINIIPEPQIQICNNGYNKAVFFDVFCPEIKFERAESLLQIFNLRTGLSLKISNSCDSAIVLIKSDCIEGSKSKEAYKLKIDQDKITLIARDYCGFYYGLQTLAQLFLQTGWDGNGYKLPCLEIIDYPELAWRGLLLDVGRHFFDKKIVKKFIDTMSYYKFNMLHLHLTEDQGWRVEIKKYPLLTEIGSWRKQTLIGNHHEIRADDRTYDGKIHGGFFTQQDIREIVEYASDRFVTIVPEIGMPGHSLAAIAAYPELSCREHKVDVACCWGVYEDVYCLGKDEVFEFNTNVLKEVIDLFPSEYIHIGGDEVKHDRWKQCPVCQKKIKELGLKDEKGLQLWFNTRIKEFLAENDRKMICWDDADAVPDGATVMPWFGELEACMKSALSGNDSVMTPNQRCYLDYYQGSPEKEPMALSKECVLPLDVVYSYNPVPDNIRADQVTKIKGMQGCLWTEYISNQQHLEYMTWPRAMAIVQSSWKGRNKESYNVFCEKLDFHFQMFDKWNIRYRNIK